MEIISDKEEMIFRKDFNNKPNYSIGLSKKDKKPSKKKFENMIFRFKLIY